MTETTPPITPLGEILLERKLLKPSELEAALEEQRRTRSRLGDILVGNGTIAMFTLYQAIATHHGLPYANLIAEPCDASLLNVFDLYDYIDLRALPWKLDGDCTVLATSEPDTRFYDWAERTYGNRYQVIITSPYDIRCMIEKHFAYLLEADSRMNLFNVTPEQSARITLKPEQRVGFFILFILCTLCITVWPTEAVVAIIAFLQLIYSATMLFKWQVFRVGKKHPIKENPALKRPLPTDDALPIYTILIPLYKEKDVLPQLLEAIKQIDYPASKLDIKLVLEADDTETILAAMECKPRWNIDIIRVPPSEPRTKPKALNYALRFARGEYVTVYDAEDIPDSLQLKKAVAAFQALPFNVACLQSRLNYYNANDNLLTRWFSMEYGILFNALLPGLQAMSIPLPLGGTSNHLAIQQLRRLGEWDPYNVTEDADLGVRLSARGLRTVMIDSLTMEEAPVRMRPWLRQRSRWVKGYMQTWLVHMRDPINLWQRLGTRSFMGFQFFVGLACISFLSAPIVWTLSVLTFTDTPFFSTIQFPAWLSAFALGNLILHFISSWVQSASVMPQLDGYAHNRWKFRIASILFPIYWVFHSIASYKSLWQLLVKPHFWEKTSHGHAKGSKSSPKPS